ncbi:MAG: alpha/beta hydrolase family protein [Acidobacteriota bacterium]
MKRIVRTPAEKLFEPSTQELPLLRSQSRRKFLRRSASLAVAPALASTAALAGKEQGSEAKWPERRKEIVRHWLDLLGEFPTEVPSLKPKMKVVADEEGIKRYHVSFQSEPDDRVTAWLLVPESVKKQPTPAIICIHSTTFGTGKDKTAGLAGTNLGDPPESAEASRAYGRELARWGYVTLCIDLLCDGERVAKGQKVLDSSEFYRRHRDWSIVGKNTWDVMRSVDFLQTLDFVDDQHIGCVGHSLGGHSTLFAAAFEPRLTASVCNGGLLDWIRKNPHWARPEDHDPQAEVERSLGYRPSNVGVYTYIKRFRPYIEDPRKPIPVDFDSLMMLVAPRPLLVMGTEHEFAAQSTPAKCARAYEVYRDWQDTDGLPNVVASRERCPGGHAKTLEFYKVSSEKLQQVYARLGAADRLTWFSYPGGHGYPPVAKRFSFSWFDRWFGHTPSVPTIWPREII